MFIYACAHVFSFSLKTQICFLLAVCEEGFFGDGCEEECQCGIMGDCDPFTGRCICGLGWHGPTCEETCPPGRFGPSCVHSCQCQNGASCDAVTGCCMCKPGFYGQSCEIGNWFSKHYSSLRRKEVIHKQLNTFLRILLYTNVTLVLNTAWSETLQTWIVCFIPVIFLHGRYVFVILP